ncbi:MAG: phosphotransferase [Rhodobacteraceae bacterium]|jgi:hypothetical protein|nr:phosphotransferase [Paracoccaceae bacterium]
MNGLQAWNAQVLGQMPGGGRSCLWRVEIAGVLHVARAGAASQPALRWLDRVQSLAQRLGIRLAPLVPTVTGALSANGWTIEPFLPGQPGQARDLPTLRVALRRLHRMTHGWPPRPGLMRRVPVGRGLLPQPDDVAVVHGGVHPGNVIRLPEGQLALIDWEESRVDDVRLDLGFDRNASGRRDHILAEVQACWWAEPARARAMVRQARLFWT